MSVKKFQIYNFIFGSDRSLGSHFVCMSVRDKFEQSESNQSNKIRVIKSEPKILRLVV